MKTSTILVSLTTAIAVALGMSSTASADTTYQIKSGDTLSKIAKANSTDVDTLAKLNNISNVNLIIAGDTIKLAGDTSTTNATAVSSQTSAVSAPVTTAPAQSAQSTVTTTVPQNTTAPTTTSSDSDTSALNTLISRESGGNTNATNGQYYGIGQLSPQARATYGGNSSDYNDQLNAMNGYIKARYGNATNALAHSTAYGWY